MSVYVDDVRQLGSPSSASISVSRRYIKAREVFKRPVLVGEDRAEREGFRFHRQADVEVKPRGFRRALKPLALDADAVGHRQQLVEIVRPHMTHDHAPERMALIRDCREDPQATVADHHHNRGGWWRLRGGINQTPAKFD